MPKHGKHYAQALLRYDQHTAYTPDEAIELVRMFSYAKFDETVEAALRLGIDPRKADQLLRGTVALPHGTGKTVRVAVFADGDKLREAEAAGADLVGGKELVDEIQGGRGLDFDVAIATPSMMSEVGKLGRVLGPRGLMPNPKAGTVTVDVEKAVSDFKGGKIEYRNDRYGNIHAPIGKVSFDTRLLVENLAALISEIVRSRPASAKGRFVRNISISSTMGPGVRIDVGAIDDLIALAH